MEQVDFRKLALKMFRNGKAEFFIRDTLVKKGATYEETQNILEDINAFKDANARKDKKTAHIILILALIWALIFFLTPILRQLLVTTIGMLLFSTPFLLSSVFYIKARYRLSNF